MWMHDLNQNCPYDSIVTPMSCLLYAHNAGLGAYKGFMIGLLHTNLKSKYYSMEKILKLGLRPYLIIFTSDGILCTSVKYNLPSKTQAGCYIYTGVSGFISANDIVSTDVSIIGTNVTVELRNGIHYHFIGRPISHITPAIKFTIDSYPYINTISKFVTGNMFDLKHDPSFAGIPQHTSTLKAHFGDYSSLDNTQLVGIKARYTPRANTDVFKNCIHQRKYFMATFTGNYISLLPLNKDPQEHLFFFTGESYYIPVNYLSNEAVYTPSPKKKWIILVSPAFILTFTNPTLIRHTAFKDYTQNNILYSYIGDLDPIVIRKLEYKRYIKNEYHKIAQGYKNLAKHGSLIDKINLYFNTSHLVGNLILFIIFSIASAMFLVACITAIFPNFIWNNVVDASLIATYILIFICMLAWSAYNRSQATSPALAITLSILAAIIFPVTSLTSNKIENIHNNRTASVLSHQIHGNYYLDNSYNQEYYDSSVTANNQTFPTTFVIHSHHLIWYDNHTKLNNYKRTSTNYDGHLIMHLKKNNHPKRLSMKASKNKLKAHGFYYIKASYAKSHHLSIITPQLIQRICHNQTIAHNIINNHNQKVDNLATPFGYIQLGHNEYKVKIINGHPIMSTARFYMSAQSFSNLENELFNKTDDDESAIDNLRTDKQIQLAKEINSMDNKIEPIIHQNS